MRFTEGDHTRGYLHGLLLDGARPFLYRSGVRHLLGVADGGGSVSYAPPPPPAGFQYAQRFRPDGPGGDAQAGDHEIVREYPGRIGRSVQEAEPSRRAEADRLPAPADAHIQRMPAATPSPAVASRMPADPAAPTLVPSVTPPAVGEPRPGGHTHLEVPGVSRPVRDFPALRTTIDPVELLPGGEKRSSASANPEEGPASVSPAMPAARQAPAAASAPQGSPASPVPAASPRMMRSSGQVASSSENMKILESPRGPSAPMPHQSSAPVTAATVAPARPVPVATGRHAVAELPMPVRARETARGDEAAEGVMVPADPLAGALTVRAGSAGRLEQLVERAVARRVAEEREEWEAERPRVASPPEPAARVVVVRGAGREKIPCAFWERSYLSRFRIMTLR